ncbi:hypothetical protein C475_19608 [Halosimplex carlsbadense 2-9-1]|uniref:Uncharacterized protein n=1 Tax=Halosimplex carlsbadense 2-9-1 TaxID=797114 RepID=M0CG25_9EURY|nr:hypothetical protein C475_19608 [Halosimplex carlsbadense 2-9-1]
MSDTSSFVIASLEVALQCFQDAFSGVIVTIIRCLLKAWLTCAAGREVMSLSEFFTDIFPSSEVVIDRISRYSSNISHIGARWLFTDGSPHPHDFVSKL